VNSLTAGAAIAVAVAGWPLYSLVTTGSMDATSALVRGGIVAGGCAFGVSVLVNLAVGFERDAETARRRRLTSLFDTMQDAVSDGVLVDKDSAKDRPAGPPAAPPPAAGAGS
jgi:hypothetical protein